MDTWNHFAQYIIDNYKGSHKIVEVGVGKIFEPSDILRKKLVNTKINVVDIHPARDDVICDDIIMPTKSIYEDADLIYSIRPPEELQKDIIKLGVCYGSDVIIKPLLSEEINYNLQDKLKLVNYKKISFYIYRQDRNQD